MDVWTIGKTIKDAEKVIIERALKFYHYNKTATAKSLGISVRGMDNKIKAFEIEVIRYGSKNTKSDNRE
jgi:transcriptional regulator with PAS, ATPase and Fis domain